jgi:hypothetical protein
MFVLLPPIRFCNRDSVSSCLDLQRDALRLRVLPRFSVRRYVLLVVSNESVDEVLLLVGVAVLMCGVDVGGTDRVPQVMHTKSVQSGVVFLLLLVLSFVVEMPMSPSSSFAEPTTDFRAIDLAVSPIHDVSLTSRRC